MSAKATAYSYVRFSNPQQAGGDSVARQAELRDAWLARHENVILDTSVTLHDLGKSAFTGLHRENPDRHALALFLKLVETGRVARGSYLLLENLDRLSREDEVPACHLLTGILMAGIRVVQLSPYEMALTDKSNGWELMRAVMELSRGHGESALKSERIGKAWARKKAAARECKDRDKVPVLTRMLPAWLEERGGRLVLIPARAAAVKRIFELSAAGYGELLICRRLEREGHAPFGKSGRWRRVYVGKILRSRAVYGEYQPMSRRTGKPDGAPIPNYFPKVIPEAEWRACRGHAAERLTKKPGRRGHHINVFAGLLRGALTGGTVVNTGPVNRSAGTRQRVLISLAAHQGRERRVSFPAATFETAILSLLREINPHDILNGDHPDKSGALAAELTGVEAELAAATAYLEEKGFSRTIADRITRLEAAQRDLAAQLAVARQEAAHPLSESWGETQSLIETLAAAPDPDDARMRLRGALRRIVEGIYLVVVARGSVRVCAVQVWFEKGKKHRDYLIVSRPAYGNGKKARTEPTWSAASLAPVITRGLSLDLRRRKDAADLATALEAANLEDLVDGSV
jgi:DNA invertase Pin-like site-specific DNA recombinase